MGKLETECAISNVNVQLAACREGLGYAQLPCYIGDRCDAIVCAPGAETYKGQDVWLLYHEDFKSTAKICALRSFLTDLLKSSAGLFNAL